MEELFISDLPQCIKSDILLCKYQEAIESSLIFKDDSGAVDVSLSNSIL
jgi:2-C-methyl-D-erythritol 4-phosphate cytidylyltransferase